MRELVYSAIRACGPVPASGRAAMLRLAEIDPEILPLFTGEGHGPAPVQPDETAATGGIAPEWLTERLSKSDIWGEEAEALLGRAPLDLRVNTLKADRATLELPVSGEHLAAAQGLRFEAGTQVEQWDAYRNGLVEIQDHGSQWACHAMNAKPGETIIDLCAGAGGKTLALAAAMQNQGKLLATDTDRGRLSRLRPRAEGAGAGIIESMAGHGGARRRGRCAGRCALFGYWNLAPQSRSALAAG